MDCIYRALFTYTECITPVWEQMVISFGIGLLLAPIIVYGLWCCVSQALEGGEDMVKSARRAYDKKREAEMVAAMKEALDRR